MKYNIFIIVLLLLTVLTQTFAETSDGTIPFDCPDIPNPKFQFHFTRELIALAVTTAPFTTVDDIYVHIYDAEAGVYEKLAQYYGENLKAKHWHNLQEDDGVQLYALNGTTTPATSQGDTVTGIFALIKGDADVYLLNIVGSVPSQQTGQLLTNLSKLGIEIPELESPPVSDADEQPDYVRGTGSFSIRIPFVTLNEQPPSSPTRFRTAKGSLIHEVQIRGNHTIDSAEILETLETGDEDIEKAVGTLRKKMVAELETVESNIREKNGKHIAVITVKEHPSLRSSDPFTMNPMMRFNRVSGWKLGTTSEFDFARARFSNGTPTSSIFGYIGYGFGNKITDVEIGIDTMPFATYTQLNNPEGDAARWYHGFGINARVHRTTYITPDNVIPYRVDHSFNDPFGLVYNIFGAEDLHNYYLKGGFEMAFRWQELPRMAYIPPKHLITLALLAENHKSLEKSTDWHLFNWRSTSKARENPAITPGRMRSVLFTYDLNLRQGSLGAGPLGWHNTFFLEHSRTAFGSDFDFTRYQLHLRYAHPLGKHRIRTRGVGSFSTASLPIQRQFTIGGPGVLNGYPLYAFAGDRGYLFNIEYFYPLPEPPLWRNLQFNTDFNLFLVLFLEAGQVWNVTDEIPTLAPKSDVGIGFQFGESDSFFRFNVAKAFETEQGVQFNLLWFYSF